MARIGRQAFDGPHLFVGDFRKLGLARAHRLAVDVHRAGAAQSGAAAEFRAGQFEMFANNPEQRRLGVSSTLAGLPLIVKATIVMRTSPSFGARADMALRVVVCSALVENGAVFSVRMSDVLLLVGEF
jgi:hypothetical protein